MNIKNFFWFSSGANQSLLKRCPTESNKYIGIGTTVVFTGIFASLSGGYALYTVFNSTLWACLFGFLWGSMIYNLDRYIVCSMKKSNSTWQEWKIALPRILLALLLAFVIATPLELKIFEKEINVEVDSIKKNKAIKMKEENNTFFQPQIQEKQNKINQLNQEIDNKAKDASQKDIDYNDETKGKKTDRTSGKEGIGPEARKKDKLRNEANQELTNTKKLNQTKIEELNREITALQKERDERIGPGEIPINKSDGLNTRIQALHNIGGIETIFITLLFIAIELAPIVVKLLSPRGPYDDLLENHEHSIQVFKEEQIAKRNQKTNERLQIIVDSSNNAIREENEANKNILQKIVQAETELAQEMITQWKAEEMSKIKSGKYKQKEE